MDLSNWFGLTNGKYFGEPPLYVDKQLQPGMTNMPKPTVQTWLQKSPFILITSPNFVWATISLLMYFYAPYDLSPGSTAALAPVSYAFLSERLPLWLPLVLGYFAFWHVTLYGFKMGSRPFIADRMYNLDKLVHNAFWTTSGIVIWTVFENVFCYLWATGRLPYVNDVTSFYTTEGQVRFLAALMGVPVWRSIHFYFAHRLLHYGPLYQQVHSLHHRNTDIEPFSGLCMHPVEHLYYYACILPSLVFMASPYAFVWNGVHLLLSPAASHSGYEDHFQSDMFHYLHHRYFECNYAGSDAAFMDIFFGTFKASFLEHPVDKDGPKAREDAKSTLRLIPTREFVSYLSLSALCVLLWGYAALNRILLSPAQAWGLASVVGFGPVLLATLVSNFFGTGRGVKPVNMNIAANLIHLTVGSLFCSAPITNACRLALQ
jgi:sterol desaturase/sphingolipid hydroxylase (fatty acid hydroxylase superfamily)